MSRVSELVAQHEAQRQEDMLALQEKEKRYAADLLFYGLVTCGAICVTITE